ncbi:MAG: 4Fe-4S dicluster domain-containing protein [Magnetovibrio sp.]|nr:4Fe-4S dicluster domain-containing protein [Magnetovibrio sp.]
MTDKSMNSVDKARRNLLKGGAAAAVVTLAPGVTLQTVQAAVTGPATSAKRWGMLVDANAPEGVWDLAVEACKAEQGWGKTENVNQATDPQWIRKVSIKDPKTGAKATLPVMCQHCAKPPCVDVCPTGASMKRADGIVLVDKHICIGCRFCMMACPYSCRSFVHEDVRGQKPHMPRGKGTVEACTMCVHRVDKGQKPACVDAVNAAGSNAIIFGDLNDPNSDIARAVSKFVTQRIRSDLGVEPGIHYRGI